MAYLLDKDGYQLVDVAGFYLTVADDFVLITDRTQADVNRVLELASKGQHMTAEEMEEWLSGLKGAYNYTDLNRVEAAVEYIAEKLRPAGFVFYPVVKKDWTMTDFPTVSDMERYVKNIQAIRSSFPRQLPEAPDDMDGLTFVEANNIEKILLLVNDIVSNISKHTNYSGEFYSGEV